MTGTNGVVIGVLVLFASLMCSWIVRWMMRRRSKLARAHLR
jgi:hypothetical protein